MDRRLLCVWDANLNRAREGIRVVEDLARFVYREATWTSELKTLRHALTRTAGAAVPEQEAVLARAAGRDVGAKPTPPSESARAGGLDLLQANFNRAAEAVRVLEETAKLLSGLGAAAATSKKFKALRFRLYAAEEKMVAHALRVERLRKFEAATLYVVLDSRQFRAGLNYVSACKAALKGGAGVVQLRDKLLKGRRLLTLARALAALCHRSGALFILNDRTDLALASGADGLHLGQEDLPIAAARALLGPDKLIGKSTHSLRQARQAVKDGADYISVGPVHATPSKPGAPAVGLRMVREVSRELAVPFVAVGGLDASNAALVTKAGAQRIGVIRAVVSAKNPAQAAQTLSRLVKKKRKRPKR